MQYILSELRVGESTTEVRLSVLYNVFLRCTQYEIHIAFILQTSQEDTHVVDVS